MDLKYFVNLNNFAKFPREYNKKQIKNLIKLFNDTTKDFAANLVLYYITQEQVNPYYLKFNSIQEWRDKHKSYEVKEWNRKFTEMYSK